MQEAFLSICRHRSRAYIACMMLLLKLRKAQAHPKAFFYPAHRRNIQAPELFLQPSFVNGSYLLQQDNRILRQSVPFSFDFYMRRKLCLIYFRGNCRHDDRRAVPVAHVVLQNQYRPYSALFTAYHRRQIGVIDLAPFYQFVSPSLAACSAAGKSTAFYRTKTRGLPAARARIKKDSAPPLPGILF